MKKTLCSLTALLLSLVLLGGCALRPASLSGPLSDKLDALAGQFGSPGPEAQDGERVRNPDGLKFSEMRYERPDTEQLAADVRAVMDALERGAPLDELETLLDRCLDDDDRFDTMYALANIHNSKDLRDEYYAAEYEWCGTQGSSVSQLFDEMYYACAGSPLGAALEEDYFWDGFCERYADPNDSRYTDATVALMQRESELVSRYRELMADPVVTFRGEERSVYELFDELSGRDYLTALSLYYEKYNEPLAEIYIELMRTHSAMAEEMGYESCEAMAFDFFFNRDYTPEDAARFVEEVRTTLVPLYTWAEKRQLSYRCRPSPLSGSELYAGVRHIAKDIGGDCAEAFDFMSRYELCDIEADLYKADASFEIYLDDYDCPYIFLKPVGTTEDLMTFMHEFGHFTDSYVNFDATDNLDIAEFFSQGLEFLSLGHLDGVLDEAQIEALRLSGVLDALNTFVSQSAFAAFESRAHALGADRLDAETLNELALQAAKDFGLCPDGMERYYRYFWMDITHFFEYPFYVISYPVSLSIALQFYELELQEAGAGLAKYFEVLPRDYDGFLETVENGGLTSPFAEGSLTDAAAAIAETIGYPQSFAVAA